MRIKFVLEAQRVPVKEIPEVRCLFLAAVQAPMCWWVSRPTVLLLLVGVILMGLRESPSMQRGLSLMFAHGVHTGPPRAGKI